MPDNEDHFRLWVISGVIGNLVRDFIVLLLVLSGVFKTAIWNVAADIFLKLKDVFTFWGIVIGLSANKMIGAGLGVFIGLLIERTGAKSYILKGLTVSLGSWLLFIGVILHNLPSMEIYSSATGETPVMIAISILTHAIFGIVTAWTYLKLAKLEI